MTQLPSVPVRNGVRPAFKVVLAVGLSVVCLLILLTPAAEASGRGGSGGGRSGAQSFARRSGSTAQFHQQKSIQKQKTTPPHKHKHKHKRKHKDQGDLELDIDGDGDDASADGDEAEAADADDAADSESAEAVVYGMEIIALFKGTAAKEGLEIGDIILSVNGTPTPNFETLSQALARSAGRAQVVVIRDDDEDDEQETVTLYPANGLIGVSVEPARVD